MTAAFAATLTSSGEGQELVAQPGAPATSFPKPDRPVAHIVGPIWGEEKERDKAGEPGQLVRLLGIRPGMTVADLGAGSGYLRRTIIARCWIKRSDHRRGCRA